jgi:excisionase family DNA binding protein
MAKHKRTRLDAMNASVPVNPIGVSRSEAAELLGISLPKLNELMERGDFPVARFGGKVIISYEGLRYWMLKQVGYEDKIKVN